MLIFSFILVLQEYWEDSRGRESCCTFSLILNKIESTVNMFRFSPFLKDQLFQII